MRGVTLLTRIALLTLALAGACLGVGMMVEVAFGDGSPLLIPVGVGFVALGFLIYRNAHRMSSSS